MYNNQINQLVITFIFTVLVLRLFCDYSHIQQSMSCLPDLLGEESTVGHNKTVQCDSNLWT